ncbi:unnamed protein product [Jaminaea pallidilutea]
MAQQKRKRTAKNAEDQGDWVDDVEGNIEANQTLPVGELPSDFDGVPLDGSTYLAMVRQEAALQPSVMIAPSNPYKRLSASSSRTAAGSRQLGIPSQEWQLGFQARFKAMREALSLYPATKPDRPTVGRLPKPNSTDRGNKAWFRFVFQQERPTNEFGELVEGDDDDQDDKNEDEGATADSALGTASAAIEPLQPTPALLLRFATSQELSLLAHLPYWIPIPLPHQPNDPNADPRSQPATPPILSQWSFALLSKLDTRLDSEQISVLRTLARANIAAIALRRTRIAQALQTDARMIVDDDREEEMEAGAWTTIAIIAGVWGQSDLWEAAEDDLVKVPIRRSVEEGSS